MNTEIIARAVIRRDDHVLLARQRGKSWSFLPGGHVEAGERVEAALGRELAEELSIKAQIGGFVGVVEHGYSEDGTAHHELSLVFAVDIHDAEPAGQEAHLEFHWLPLRELADADVRPHTVKDAVMAAGDAHGAFWSDSPA